MHMRFIHTDTHTDTHADTHTDTRTDTHGLMSEDLENRVCTYVMYTQ